MTDTATFILVTLHVNYGDSSTERIPELKGIARWMADWAKRSNKWHHNLLALGDFNIAWFTNKSGAIALSMDYSGGGSFDFLPYAYSGAVLTKSSISHRISDHYPLWVEFTV